MEKKSPTKQSGAAPAVLRRRRKVTRETREQTPEPAGGLLNKPKSSDSESESMSNSETAETLTKDEIKRKILQKMEEERTVSDHQRKIMDKKNKSIIARRSQSNPRQAMSPEEEIEVFDLMKKAKRSLSSPREKQEREFEPIKKTEENKSAPNLDELNKEKRITRKDDPKKVVKRENKPKSPAPDKEGRRSLNLDYGNDIYNQTKIKSKTSEATDVEEDKEKCEEKINEHEENVTVKNNDLAVPNTSEKSENGKEKLIEKKVKDNRNEKLSLIESFKQAQKSSTQVVVLPKPEVTEEYESSTESCSSDMEMSSSQELLAKKPSKMNNKLVGEPEKAESTSFIKIVFTESKTLWRVFKVENLNECEKIRKMRNRCISDLVLLCILCGLGGIIFKFTEGAFENFYKCGVKRVKRDFVDQLWYASHNLREDDWKQQARTKLRKFEEELHAAHEAGMKTYSGQKGWSFLNGVLYCLTVVTTIGYGHISPVTTTGRALTIVYAIFGIPIFLILLADFGKLFTRCIKFLWAFVRRLYYTGSCRKVRKNAQMQEVMKGINMVYDIATFRRPSQIVLDEENRGAEEEPRPLPISPKTPSPSTPTRPAVPVLVRGFPGPMGSTHGTAGTPQSQSSIFLSPGTHCDTPQTPAPSNFEIDDEFNLPISLAIIILVIYIFVGATIYYIWEQWSFFESFYFVFISMTTIGFGDFVPQHPMYMMASIVYLVFGMALTSMCINVVQVKLSDSFKHASAKIGATIGFSVPEEGEEGEEKEGDVELAEGETSDKAGDKQENDKKKPK